MWHSSSHQWSARAAWSSANWQVERSWGRNIWKALVWKTWNSDARSLVGVRAWNNLDDLVAWELQLWDIHGSAGHHVAIDDAEDGLVGDDEDIGFEALELEDDWLEANSEVMIGLDRISTCLYTRKKGEAPYLSTWPSVMIWIHNVLPALIWVLFVKFLSAQSLVKSWVELDKL